jgi:predicted nucleic acid-binding protein
MPDKKLTFVDASLLIRAARKQRRKPLSFALALLILESPEREFVASEFLRMEVLPFAQYFQRAREIHFYKTFFNRVTKWADTGALLPAAFQISSEDCVGVLDALHIAAAQQFDAEFISAERTTKPIYRASGNISTIY